MSEPRKPMSSSNRDEETHTTVGNHLSDLPDPPHPAPKASTDTGNTTTFTHKPADLQTVGENAAASGSGEPGEGRDVRDPITAGDSDPQSDDDADWAEIVEEWLSNPDFGMPVHPECAAYPLRVS